MELKRARELAKTWRYQNDAWTGGSNPTLSESAMGMIILDNRITELEAQRDELLEVAKAFCHWWYRNPQIHAVPIPIHQPIFGAVGKIAGKTWEKDKAEASDKEDAIRIIGDLFPAE